RSDDLATLDRAGLEEGGHMVDAVRRTARVLMRVTAEAPFGAGRHVLERRTADARALVADEVDRAAVVVDQEAVAAMREAADLRYAEIGIDIPVAVGVEGRRIDRRPDRAGLHFSRVVGDLMVAVGNREDHLVLGRVR